MADLGFLVGNLVLTAMLLPTLTNPRSEVPRLSSCLTSLTLMFMGAVHASIDLWGAAASTWVAALIWLLIFIFRPIRHA